MSELTIKLIIILIPGAIATLIFGKLVLHKEWSSFRFILYSILFGVFAYVILQFAINFLNLCTCASISGLTIWDNLTNAYSIPYLEVFFATIVSFFLAFLMGLVENQKWISRFAKRLNISYKYGGENLFSRFLNDKKIDYVYLRDIKNNLTYHGWIKSFSES
ncbi:MAG: hypothetical protein AAGL29_03855, partial [Bacteroidota bacterium]